MIFNIRGTSGSGKSTIVRRVMERAIKREPDFIPGRRQPILYRLAFQNSDVPLVVIGHYETACGGCDTISKMDDIFELIKRESLSSNVIYEGLLLAAEVNRTVDLHKATGELRVIALDVPIDECLASVNRRRREKNPDASDVNPKNTISKHRGVQLSVERLRQAGVPVQVLSREAALSAVLTGLGQ